MDATKYWIPIKESRPDIVVNYSWIVASATRRIYGEGLCLFWKSLKCFCLKGFQVLDLEVEY